MMNAQFVMWKVIGIVPSWNVAAAILRAGVGWKDL
jgi:hypothetical protein